MFVKVTLFTLPVKVDGLSKYGGNETMTRPLFFKDGVIH